jgi:holo-[acyl-carrier protein] synthase
MIVAIGIDVIEVSRIEEAFARQGGRFRKRVFTEAESDYCESRASRFHSYAARFAAKEAVMKALGTGWADGIRWRDIEITFGESGRPAVELSGRALARFCQLGCRAAHLSLTHSRDLAVAQVIFEA